MIQRYSSRRQNLKQQFLNKKLQNAVTYDRIAGYFRSSLIEAAGEALEAVQGNIRIVCNSDISIDDAKAFKTAIYAQKLSWTKNDAFFQNTKLKSRFEKLADLITSKKLTVKVLPDEAFGLIHGKAGVITYKNNKKTAFIGSVNESYTAWSLNYELLWEDDSEDAVKWVQEEFDALWNSKYAYNLSEFIINDIVRLSKRTIITVEHFKTAEIAAPAVIELPIYRKDFGFMPHQKYFIEKTYKAHLKRSARFVLADQVGLGKTVQLAASAMLMALLGDKPIIVLAPKTLVTQWQEELIKMLNLPSAIWTSKGWIDENGILHPSIGAEYIKKCPRRIGIISQGLITTQSEIVDYLKEIKYECVIVDEAHRARRRNINNLDQKPDYNNLMRFLIEISKNTKSLLLATATPIQIHPIEAWDLLNLLSIQNDHILGNAWSKWRKDVSKALEIVSGRLDVPEDESWEWIRNPFPESEENPNAKRLRRSVFEKDDNEAVIPGDYINKINTPMHKKWYNDLKKVFAKELNPFIRFIIRRTRKFLEENVNPETGEYYLTPIGINLYGEGDTDAINMPHYFKVAYENAEEFCKLLKDRIKGGGFFKTIVLRRLGSSINAGINTIEKLLAKTHEIVEEEDEDVREKDLTDFLSFTEKELEKLNICLEALKRNRDEDPKYLEIKKYLFEKNWFDDGCIIFSQYYDTASWFAEKISRENILKDEKIGLYVGGSLSGIYIDGKFESTDRDNIKKMVMDRNIKLMFGTDAASEGLNLQKMGSLINLDLPWNPTRLEQRKGRIARMGQGRDEVNILNLRYKDSIEDKVHKILAERLKDIYDIFGQIPDILEDVWINVIYGEIEQAKLLIDGIVPKHPFDEKYNKVESVEWENCYKVLNSKDVSDILKKPW